MTKSKFSQIPKIKVTDPRSLQRAIDVMARNLNIMTGSSPDSVVTQRSYTGIDDRFNKLSSTVNDLSLTSPGNSQAQRPQLPTGFIGSASLSNVVLNWDEPGYKGHAYTVVLFNQDDVLGEAKVIGTASFPIFIYPVNYLSSGYYWIKHVNSKGVIGPVNASAGLYVEAQQSPEELLELLSSDIANDMFVSETLLSRISVLDSVAVGEHFGLVNANLALQAADKEKSQLLTNLNTKIDDASAFAQNERAGIALKVDQAQTDIDSTRTTLNTKIEEATQSVVDVQSTLNNKINDVESTSLLARQAIDEKINNVEYAALLARQVLNNQITSAESASSLAREQLNNRINDVAAAASLARDNLEVKINKADAALFDAETGLIIASDKINTSLSELDDYIKGNGGVDARIINLNQVQSDLVTNVTVLQTASGNLSSRIGVVETASDLSASRLSNVEIKQGDHTSQIVSLETARLDLAESIRLLGVEDGELGSKISTVETATIENAQRVSDLATTTGTLTSRITSVETVNSSQASTLSSLSVEQGSLQARMLTQETATTDAVESLRLLGIKDGELSSQISTVETATIENAQRVSDLTTTAGNLTSRITSVEQTSASSSQKIAQLETVQGDNSSKITNLQQTTATSAQEITQLKATDAAVTADISSIKSVNSTQAQQLNSITTQQDTHQSQISVLQTTTANQASVSESLTYSNNNAGDKVVCVRAADFTDESSGVHVSASPRVFNTNEGVEIRANGVSVFSRKAIKIRTDRVYKVRIKVKQLVAGSNGQSLVYAGVVPLREDMSIAPAQSGGAGSYLYCGVSAYNLTVAAGWKTFEGTISGVGLGHHNFRPETVYVRPMMIVNYQSSGSPKILIDSLEIWDVTEELALNGKIDARYDELKQVSDTSVSHLQSLQLSTDTNRTLVTTQKQVTDGHASQLNTLEVEQGSLQARMLTQETASTDAVESLRLLGIKDGELSSQISTVETATIENAQRVSDLATTTGTLTSRITSVESVNSNQASTLNSLSVEQGSLQARMLTQETASTDAVESLRLLGIKDGELSSQISTVETATIENAQRVSDLATTTGNLTSRITSVESVNSSQASTLNSLSVEQGSLQARMLTQETASTDAVESLRLLGIKDGELSSQISTVETATIENAQRVSDLTTTAGNLTSRITSVEQTTASSSQKIAQLETVQGDNSSKITNLQQTTATSAQEITQLKATDAAVTADISSIKSVNNTQAQQLNSISTQQDTHQSQISVLQTTTANQASVSESLTYSNNNAGDKVVCVRAADFTDATSGEHAPVSTRVFDTDEGIEARTTGLWVFSRKAIKVRTDRVYKVRFKVKQLVNADNGVSRVYAGVVPLREDMSIAPMQSGGAGTYLYFGVSSYQLTVAQGWKTFEGTISGVGLGANNFRPDTVYVRPMLIVNYQSSGSPVALIDSLELWDVTEELALNGKIDARYDELKQVSDTSVSHLQSLQLSTDTNRTLVTTQKQVTDGHATLISTLQSVQGANSAQIVTLQNTTSTHAQTLQQLAVNIDSKTAAVETSAKAYADDLTGALKAEKVIKVDANGVVAGFGVLADSNTGSTIYLSADKVAIVPPNWNPSETSKRLLPFVYSAEYGRVVMDKASIVDLTADKITGGNLTVDNFTTTQGFQVAPGSIKRWMLEADFKDGLVRIDPTAEKLGGGSIVSVKYKDYTRQAYTAIVKSGGQRVPIAYHFMSPKVKHPGKITIRVSLWISEYDTDNTRLWIKQAKLNSDKSITLVHQPNQDDVIVLDSASDGAGYQQFSYDDDYHWDGATEGMRYRTLIQIETILISGEIGNLLDELTWGVSTDEPVRSSGGVIADIHWRNVVGAPLLAEKNKANVFTADQIVPNLHLNSGGKVFSKHNNSYILGDHGNGNVTVNAAGGNLLVGYVNTVRVDVYSEAKFLQSVSFNKDALFSENVHIDCAGRTIGSVGKDKNLLTTAYLKASAGIAIYSGTSALGLDSNEFVTNVSEFHFVGNDKFTFQTPVDLKQTTTHSGNFITANTQTRFSTPYGFIDFGPKNATYAHIYTDRPNFYFNKELLVNANKVWHSGNDGAGSGLDADLLDGVNSTQLVRNDINNSMTATLGIEKPGIALHIGGSGLDTADSSIYLGNSSLSDGANGGLGYLISYLGTGTGVDNDFEISSNFSGRVTSILKTNMDGVINFPQMGASIAGNAIWHAGNDGSGSGLDADRLDGLDSLQFLRSDIDDQTTGRFTIQHSLSNDELAGVAPSNAGQFRIKSGNNGMSIGLDSATNSRTAWIQVGHNNNTYPSSSIQGTLELNPLGGYVSINGHTAWHAGNDGVGSGLNADKLDNLESSQFARSDTGGTLGGAGAFEYWMNTAIASNDTHPLIKTNDNSPLEDGGIYRLHAHIAGTSTNQGLVVVFWNQKGSWNYHVTAQSGNNSNHIGFLLVDGLPALRTWHSNTYAINYYIERYNLGEGIGQDNVAQMIGTDGFMGDISGQLKFRGVHDVWHSGNDSDIAKLSADQTLLGANTFNKSVNTIAGYIARNPNNTNDTVTLAIVNDTPRIRVGGVGVASGAAFEIHGVADALRLSVASTEAYISPSRHKIWHAGNDGDLGKLSSTQTWYGVNTFHNTTAINSALTVNGHELLNGTDTWLRTKDSHGVFFSTFNGGIHMTDANFVRVYNSKAFKVDSTRTLDAIHAEGGIRSDSKFFCNNLTGEGGLVGSYATTGAGIDQMIWTIGTSWATHSTHYGIGYHYGSEINGSNEHQIVIKHGGSIGVHIGTRGSAKFDGFVNAQYFKENGINIADKYLNLNQLSYDSPESWATAFTAVDQFKQWVTSGSADTSGYSTITDSIATGFVNSIIGQFNVVVADKANVGHLSSRSIEVTGRQKLVNNFSASGHLDGWFKSGSDHHFASSSNFSDLDESLLSNLLTVDGKRVQTLRIPATGNNAYGHAPVEVDHNAIYKVSVLIYAGGATQAGLRYVGLKASTTKGEVDGTLGLPFEQYSSSTRTLTNAADDNAYILSASNAWSSYLYVTGYVVGANRSVDEVPETDRAIFKMSADTKYLWMRILNWSNGSTETVLHIYNPSINEVNTGKIVAHNITANTIDTQHLAADSVTAVQLASSSVVAGTIAAGAVTTDKLAARAITADKIATNTITANEIASNTITAGQIAANAITTSELAANSVTATHILAGTITASELAANSITSAHIVAGTIVASDIASKTITAGQIAASAITATELAANSVTSAHIVAGTIVASDIASKTITAGQIAANAITASELAANSVTATHILAGTITASELAADSITSLHLSTDSVTALHIQTGTITANEIAAGTIKAANIAVEDLELVNNYSTSERGLEGWSTSGSIVNEVELDGKTVRTHKVTTTTDRQITSSSFEVDHNAIYECCISIYSDHPDDTGTRYFGMHAYDSNGTSIESDRFTAINRIFDTSNNNMYWWSGDHFGGSWLHLKCYMIGANVDVNDVPKTLYSIVKLKPNVTKARLRYLNYYNNGTSVTNHFYNPSVKKLGSSKLSATQIEAGMITSDKISTNSITSAHIVSGTIQASDIASNTITAGQIAAGTITANELAVNSVNASHIIAGSITATEINTSSISIEDLSWNNGQLSNTQFDVEGHRYNTSFYVKNANITSHSAAMFVENTLAFGTGIYVRAKNTDPQGNISRHAALRVVTEAGRGMVCTAEVSGIAALFEHHGLNAETTLIVAANQHDDSESLRANGRALFQQYGGSTSTKICIEALHNVKFHKDLEILKDVSIGDNLVTKMAKVSSDIEIEGVTRWHVATSNKHQRVDARAELDEARLHWYGVNDVGATARAKHSFYDGSSYLQWDAHNLGFHTNAYIQANGGLRQDGHIILNGGDTWLRTKNNDGIFFSSHGGGFHMEDTTWVRVYGGKRLYVPNNTTESIKSEGGIRCTEGRFSGTVWFYYSDQRLKTIQSRIDPLEALDNVNRWTAAFYRGNEVAGKYGFDCNELQIGLMAQEIEKDYPQLTTLAPFDSDENGKSISGQNFKTLQYERTTAVLTAALQGETLRRKALENKVLTMEKTLNKLLQRL